MNLKHRIKVNVREPDTNGKRTILTGGDKSIRNRILSRLLGGKVGVLVLVPEGGSISSVEIHRHGGGDMHEAV